MPPIETLPVNVADVPTVCEAAVRVPTLIFGPPANPPAVPDVF